MANVKRLKSNRELLNYINSLVLPAGGFQPTTIGATGWFVLDTGGKYTVIEEAPFKVTTLSSDRDLLDHLNNIAGTLKNVVPKAEGGQFTFVSLIDEVLGANNGFTITVSKSEQDLADDMNDLIDAGLTADILIEHDNHTIILASGWDADALEIVNNMPNVLEGFEQAAINDFVIAEKAAGNYSSYDSIIIPSFNDALNSYHDLLTNTTVSEHGTLPLSIKGFNGANGQMRILPMNSGIGIYPNYSLNDAHVSCFCQDMVDEGSPFRAVWSARDGTTSDRIDMAIRHDQAPDRAGMGFHNGLSGSFDLATTGTHHYHQNRTSNILNTLYLDGVSDETRATATAIIPDQPLSFSGRINLVNLINANFSFMSVGGSLADPASHNTNVVNLLTALGAI